MERKCCSISDDHKHHYEEIQKRSKAYTKEVCKDCQLRRDTYHDDGEVMYDDSEQLKMITGEKYNPGGWNERIEISRVVDDGKQWHVYGNGRIFHGKGFDNFQIWIPKSISRVIYRYNQMHRQIVVPKWFYDKIKVYNVREDEITKSSEF